MARHNQAAVQRLELVGAQAPHVEVRLQAIIRAKDVGTPLFPAYTSDRIANWLREAQPAVVETVAGVIKHCKMRLFKMPTGAATLTIGTIAYGSSPGSDVFTPTVEGMVLANDGTLALTADTADTIAGWLLSDYYKTSTGSDTDYNASSGWATDLKEGDLVWLIVEGEHEVLCDNATVIGRHLVPSATAGKVTQAADFNTAGTINDYHISVKNNTLEQPGFFAVAVAKAAIAAAGLVQADIKLPISVF